MAVTTDGLDSFDIAKYPDYRPGMPPAAEKLEQFSFLDEYESVWGRKWGSPGLGRFREAGLVKPDAYEGNELWAQDPTFFLLRHRPNLDIKLMIDCHQQYAELLAANGVKVTWMEFQDNWGAYGPMRKLFVCEEVRFVRGGAILPRFGHASYKRGLEREFQRFLAEVGCPILHSIHGNGICEVGPMYVPLADNVVVAGLSCGANQEGLNQANTVLRASGVEEIHVMQLPTIMDTFAAGGEFHVDMVIGPVADRLAIVYPGNLPWETYKWLLSRGVKLIEIPKDEQRFCPANLIVLEPGKVIMCKQAAKTIEAVRKAGVEVIEFDSDGIMQGGTNGIKCITMELLRDDGPRWELPSAG